MSDPMARTRSIIGLYLRHGRPPRDPEGWVDIGPSPRPRPDPDAIRGLLEALDWVASARVEVHGGYPLVVAATVVPRPGAAELRERMADAGARIVTSDWRIARVSIAAGT